MNKSAVITTRLDKEVLDLVDQVSRAQGRSRAWFAAQAIERAARQEAEFLAFIQEGVDAADRGYLIPHEEVAAELEEMIARHETQCES
jgi:predicted transcriptional regulator